MTARILYFPHRKDKTMKKRSIDAELLAMLMRNHKLIHAARNRGYSERAIQKLVAAAEQSKR